MTESERAEYARVQAVGIGPLVRGALWCAGTLLIVAGLLYVAFWLPYREPAKEPPYPVPILPETPAAGAPLPQGYEWVDRDAGVVRIPVGDAMRIAARRLPVRTGAKPGAHEKQRPDVPTDAGAGRTVPPAPDP